MDGPKVRKWTVMSQTGRSKKAKSGRSAKVDGLEIRKWTVLLAKTGRSSEIKLKDPKDQNQTVFLNKMDGIPESCWMKVDGKTWTV